MVLGIIFNLILVVALFIMFNNFIKVSFEDLLINKEIVMLSISFYMLIGVLFMIQLSLIGIDKHLLSLIVNEGIFIWADILLMMFLVKKYKEKFVR